jgi:predicted unusual protein kinase regulating ubiquinone biosynthesis (AarF/ABC1/UbiB family)
MIKNTSPLSRTLKLMGVGARTVGRTLVKNLPVGGDQAERALRYWTDVGTDLVDTLGQLRGAAMKLGQLASQYSDVLPPALAAQLRLLQRSVEPLPFSAIEPLLAEQWSDEQRAAFSVIEPTAMAAASIGQVHRARLTSGEAVVVKVRYPGVREAVDADLVQLRRLISASKLLPLDAQAMDRLMAEVRARFRDETDYAAELAHLVRLRETAAVPGVVYPVPHPDLCTAGLLVLSEESGATLEAAAEWPQAARDALGTVLCEWMAHSFFAAHAVHADPHPGNFAFRQAGQVVVYDMGCVKLVPAAVVATTVELLNAGLREDWPSVHQALQALGGVAATTPLASVQVLYAEFTAAISQRLLADASFDFAAPDFIEDIRAVARRHWSQVFTFAPVSDLVFVLRALSGLYWMLRTLRAVVPVRRIVGSQLSLGAVIAAPDGTLAGARRD